MPVFKYFPRLLIHLLFIHIFIHSGFVTLQELLPTWLSKGSFLKKLKQQKCVTDNCESADIAWQMTKRFSPRRGVWNIWSELYYWALKLDKFLYSFKKKMLLLAWRVSIHSQPTRRPGAWDAQRGQQSRWHHLSWWAAEHVDTRSVHWWVVDSNARCDHSPMLCRSPPPQIAPWPALGHGFQTGSSDSTWGWTHCLQCSVSPCWRCLLTRRGSPLSPEGPQ